MRFISTLLPFICLLLSLGRVRAQSIPHKEADSLRLVLRQHQGDTARVRALFALSEAYLKRTLNPTQNQDSAQRLLNEARELSTQLNFTRGQEEGQFLLGKLLLKRQQRQKLLALLPRLRPRARARLLLELGQDQLFTPYGRSSHRDSALYFFQQALALSRTIGDSAGLRESMKLLGSTYLAKGQLARGMAYFKPLLAARHRAGDLAGEAWLWNEMNSRVECQDSSCAQESKQFLPRAIALARQGHNVPLEIMLLMTRGYRHLGNGNSELAKADFALALARQKAIGFPAFCRGYEAIVSRKHEAEASKLIELSNANFGLLQFSFYTGDSKQKLYYALQAVKDIEASGQRQLLFYAYYQLGNAYIEYLKVPEGLVYLQKSLDNSREQGQVPDISLAPTLCEAGRVAEALPLLLQVIDNKLPLLDEQKLLLVRCLARCYTATKQYQLAEAYYLQAMPLNKPGDVEGQLSLRFDLANFYMATKQYQKAAPYLTRLLQAPPEQVPLVVRMNAHTFYSRIDIARGRYPEAIAHVQRADALEDSLFNENQSAQIEQLSAKYETEKKEQDIKLKAQNIARLTAQNQAQRTQRNALIGGTVLLLAFLGLGYNRYRLKQRSNRQLEAQQQVLRTQQAEINQQNHELTSLLGEKDQLLTEKEFLLKEIHHRVKNNLQVVMSLLSAQATSLQDQAALSAIQESQHRVHTMALLHQQLYQGEQVARIPMRHYVKELAAYLHEAYEVRPQPVRLELKLEELDLDVALAVPLGLIINEALTNAYKYAFPDGRSGTITVELHRLGGGSYALSVADDGVGMPQGQEPLRRRSLGMTLIQGFSRQIGGELTFSGPPGLRLNLVFAEERPVRPVKAARVGETVL